MRMKRAIAAACAAILLALPLPGCGEPYAPADDEIALRIQLDLDEDIGLLVIDYAAGESSGSGGVSNADKSPLRRDELLFYTLERHFFDDPSAVGQPAPGLHGHNGVSGAQLRKRLPRGIHLPAGGVILGAEFGEVYSLVISGGTESGYEAVLSAQP